MYFAMIEDSCVRGWHVTWKLLKRSAWLATHGEDCAVGVLNHGHLSIRGFIGSNSGLVDLSEPSRLVAQACNTICELQGVTCKATHTHLQI